MDERIIQIALGLLTGIGPIKAKMLVSEVGGVEAVFKATDKSLAAALKVTVHEVKKLNRSYALKRATEEVNFIEKNGISMYFYQDDRYPTQLRFCSDSPIVLFTKGNINFKKQNLSVVGTRKATAYGKGKTKELIGDLVECNPQIISGLAHGIDKIAHEAALENDLSTIAVLGHGLETIYPAVHRKLAEQMLENGGLITEFISHTPGDPSNFPKRNRIVAGLSDATVVIESAASGGSLITANLALDYDRPVFAFPGNAGKNSSAGCNELIRDEKARLITSAEDMLYWMDWKKNEKRSPVQTDIFDSLTQDEEQVVRALKKFEAPVHMDTISFESGFSAHEVSLLLFNLEMRGNIKSISGGRYQLC